MACQLSVLHGTILTVQRALTQPSAKTDCNVATPATLERPHFGQAQSLRPRLMTKSIKRVPKCGGGLITLVGRHQLGLSFQSEVRQFGSNSTTGADQIFLQTGDTIGG